MKFKHFLITRFNLRAGWKTSRDGTPVLTDDWLNHRMALFENYCFPSVANQVNKNFIWILFCDVETPLHIRRKIERLFANKVNFHVEYIEGMEQFLSSLKCFISKKIEISNEILITTRLDNDDLIHKEFINTIQLLANQQEEVLIDLINGYQIKLGIKFPEIREFKVHSNHFISLIEPVINFKTVHHKMHQEWKNSNIKFFRNKIPLWAALIHANNQKSFTNQNKYLTKNFNLYDFGINDKMSKPNFLQFLFYNFKVMVKRRLIKYRLN